MGKGSTTSQKTQTTGPRGWMEKYYKELMRKASGLSETPYEGYQGERTAGFTPYQTEAMEGVRAAQGIATPYYNQARGYYEQSAKPAYETYENYMNPYLDEVVDTTQAQFNASNKEQLNQVTGNAVLKGAMGGDRVGVAQGEAVRQQNLAQNPVIAGLRQSGFNTAIGAAQNDASRLAGLGNSMTNLGTTVQGARQNELSALWGMGTQQQQLEQQKKNIEYQEFLEKRGYPYQQAQWMAGILSGLGPQTGSRTVGTETTPGPSPLNSIVGLGMTAAGAFTGNPMMAMQGLGTAAAGQQQQSAQPQSYAPWGAQNAGGFQFSYADGGRVADDVPVIGLGSRGIIGNALGLAEKIKGFGRGGVPHREAGGGFDLDEPMDVGVDGGFVEEMEPIGPGPSAQPPLTAGFGSGSSLFSGLPKELGPALMAAGFATMASKSPHLGQAIGEGGMYGMKSFNDLKETGRKSEESKTKTALAAQKLREDAKNAAARLAETSRHNRASEGVQRENLDRSSYDWIPGSQKGEDGESVPGLWRVDKKRGVRQFFPGDNMTRKGGSPEEVAARQRALDIRERQGDRGLDIRESDSAVRERQGDRRLDQADRSTDIRERQGDRGLDLRDRDGADRTRQGDERLSNDARRLDQGDRGLDIRDRDSAARADRPAGGRGGGVAEWRYNAWLNANPGDEAGALEYSSGKRTLDGPSIRKYALSEAQKEVRAGDLDPKQRESRVAEIEKYVRGEAATKLAPTPKAAPVGSQKPTASAAPPAQAAAPAANGSLKRPTPEQLAQAKAAIERKGRDAVIQSLQAKGWDTSGL